MESAGEVTALLARLRSGDRTALTPLVSLLYPELRRVAARCLRGERKGHTLQPTALVNELYLRLLGQRCADWVDRTHFLSVSASLMRRVLVDYARRRHAVKRGGAEEKLAMDEALDASGAVVDIADVLAVDEAVTRLAELDPRQARVVELRYFGGLTEEEAATALGVSEATIKREWRSAKAWLRRALDQGKAR